MRILSYVLLLALGASQAFAWLGVEKAVYNKWHQTELERWLKDHNIAYPAASDRKDLQNLVQKNWDDFSSTSSFSSWPDNQLQKFIQAKTGKSVTNVDRKSLINQIDGLWTSGWSNLPTDKWGEAKTWIFDGWSNSQLRNFLEYHGVVNPPDLSAREKLMKAVSDRYDEIAKKVTGGGAEKSSSFYPDDWLYSSWSDSEIRNWLVDQGWADSNAPATTRDKLLVAMRTNWLSSRVINNVKAFEESASSASKVVSKSAESAKKVAESSASSLSKEASRTAKGAAAAAASKASQVSVKAQSVSDSVASAASRASVSAAQSRSSIQSVIVNSWSDSQLRVWAEENNVAIPQGIRRDELLALVSKQKDKIASDLADAQASVTSAVKGAYGAATTSAGNGFAAVTDTASGILWGATDRLRDLLGFSPHKDISEQVKDAAKDAAKKGSDAAYSIGSDARNKMEL